MGGRPRDDFFSSRFDNKWNRGENGDGSLFERHLSKFENTDEGRELAMEEIRDGFAMRATEEEWKIVERNLDEVEREFKNGDITEREWKKRTSEALDEGFAFEEFIREGENSVEKRHNKFNRFNEEKEDWDLSEEGPDGFFRSNKGHDHSTRSQKGEEKLIERNGPNGEFFKKHEKSDERSADDSSSSFKKTVNPDGSFSSERKTKNSSRTSFNSSKTTTSRTGRRLAMAEGQL